ncbi:MAG: cell surface protein SprA [Bacteroidetes bacterium GWE2_40_63]|nr:MAG: cell surface protein SprA [Bacteroidetes bacterium GWC2_40_13]OFX75583.1 MAG: cell surface protein SprA [Bacteroidetes bacterium GWD2_40_43]OFX90699.1 MAG: cell surface protein SprA [Bacteroidetes bacterium GWE2_40_63]OFY20823.1 MAG: cell surface protein SprA [Bacteroidetes bacterium GWF2_40_13]OFZ23757.1 MAG: cell surface protein SprA [Bacteroidetes bacterium RIFOXYC2_FULL_40_12]
MKKQFLRISFLLLVTGNFLAGFSQTATDTTKAPFKIQPEPVQPYGEKRPATNIDFKTPDNIVTEVEYDETTGQYIIHKKVGGVDYVPPYSMSFEEYQNYDIQKNLKSYWRSRYKSETFENQSSLIPKINIGSEAFETIFGSNTIDIKPNGSASLKFGVKISNSKNPIQPVELQRNTTFDFKEEIQMSVVGKIGENLEMKVSYDTESQFDFDNTMNLRYQGKEDDILQKVEAGDVSLPLTTSLISGSQSLFGILTELKFGNLYVTSVFSQQEGETKTITVEGGAQKSNYDISVAEYDKNRNFFLGHYFRANYDKFLENFPLVASPVKINKIEVWVTNTKKETSGPRNIVAFVDLGEERKTVSFYGNTETVLVDTTLTLGSTGYPDNNGNSLYQQLNTGDSTYRNINEVSRVLTGLGLDGGKDFEKVEYARKLTSNEYTFDANLGFISLNSALNSDEVLAVAYEYTANGQTYKVGEFAQDGIAHPQVLYLKLLKGTNFNPLLPNWKLMMKNIYSIGAYQVSKEDFKLEIEYYDDNTGTRVLNIPDKKKVLNDTLQKTKFLRLMNLDNFNSEGNYVSNGDGVFDFMEGTTILAASGKIIFPMVEPFGGYLKNLIPNKELADKLNYQVLYDSTQYKALQVTSKNKFYLKGTYKSSGGSEIILNSFNIPEGSVVVTAGGIKLTENVDYSVDYNLGRVKILNESYLASGTPIKISLESNALFSIQSKTLMGTHLDYRFNNDFNLGATIMNLTERPLTQKVNMGEEPISNTIWGLNGSYRTDAPFLTKAVDFLPFIETKEMSSITFEGEFAQLIPGHNKAIGKTGNAFIDDFEGSESSIDLRNRNGWVLASVPQGQNLFPEATDFSGLTSGYNRAKLAWYQIDPLFFRTGSPVSKDLQSNLKVYRPVEQEIYPNKDVVNGIPTEISTLDLAFYPEERGSYNFDTGTESFAAGLTPEGKLENPQSRWGGIMRELTTKDFEAQNIEYIMFWMMDPFVEDDSLNNGGKLYFNLGNISEDILKDGRKNFENGLPTEFPVNASVIAETQWGRVPAVQALINDFVNDPDLRPYQDVGFDGLSSSLDEGTGKTGEQEKFVDYLNYVESRVTNEEVKAEIISDPSADDYHYFRGSDFDARELGILDRYKDYSNSEGNSPASENSSESYTTVGQTQPDVEDINGDYTLSESESYFQYEVDLRKENMQTGLINITDIQEATVNMENGDKKQVKWYQFKIPISLPDTTVGTIQDFKSVRFMRMFMRGWDNDIVLRFANLELVRSEWRKYDYAIKEGGETTGGDESHDPNDIPFSISSVNIEENGSRTPVNYVLPPDVDRQQDPSNQQLNKLNEQSMTLKVEDMEDGYAKAVYKTLNMDMRDYGKLQMYIHAESMFEDDPINDYDVSCFVRLGSDFTNNYYEYEVPLKVTPKGSYNGNSETDRYKVWPEENNLEIDFDELIDAKMARNEAMHKANSELTYLDAYTYYHANNPENRIVIKGNPNIANVATIMIGIRNPKKKYNPKDDDGLKKSTEIWVNELRLTDFDEKGGWAATGRMSARLADFGTVSVAGSTTQPGFGSIEQSGQERSKETTNQIDVATNLELGKLFPKEVNVRIPMFIGYSRTAIKPKYNPLDQDVTMEEALNDPSLTDQEKEDLVKQVQDFTERRSINFTNVGLGQSGKAKPHFYSPSNLSASYAYSELLHHDVSIDHSSSKTYAGALNYIFNNQPKNYEPFKKVKLLQKKAFKLIGDFNFYLAPQQLSFSNSINRKYSETLLRNLNNPEQVFDPTYDKSFYWQRQFDLKYNFSKGLKISFSTNTNAYIEEPEGEVNRSHRDTYDIYKQQVWESINNFGTPNTYNQKLDVTYTIPINKIPLLSFVSANARYASTYDWELASKLKNDSLEMGNSIQNTQQINLNGQLNMDNLYNQLGFIEKINKKYKQPLQQRKKPKFEDVVFSQQGLNFKAGVAKKINHGLGTEEEINVVAKLANGKEVKADFDVINANRVEVILESDAEEVSIEVKGKKELKDSWLLQAFEHFTLVTTGFKQFSVTMTQTQGTAMSGYKYDHQFTDLYNNPGLPFIFGWQDPTFGSRMKENKGLVDSTNFLDPYTMTNNISYSFKATYQPYKDLRIDFAGQQSETSVMSEYYDLENGIAVPLNHTQKGSYNVNIWMLSTAFAKKPDLENPTSAAFEKYRENLYTVAWKLARERDAKDMDDIYNPGADTLFPEGYTTMNPEVAIPAFMAAYGGLDAGRVPLNFKSLLYLRPTWRVKYDGLIQIPFLARYFKNISLSHGYNASFTVGSYSSVADWDYWMMKGAGTDTSFFVPELDISGFAATEQFVPLVGIDATWKNNVLTKFEYKKTRNLTMSLTNNQMAEVYTWEYTIGSGYRFDKVKIKLRTPGGGSKPVESDLNLRGDISIRDNMNIIHDLSQGTSQVTQGQKVVTTKITADYQLTEKLNLQAYYDRLVTIPKVGSFKTAVTEFGFKVQFTLAQ